MPKPLITAGKKSLEAKTTRGKKKKGIKVANSSLPERFAYQASRLHFVHKRQQGTSRKEKRGKTTSPRTYDGIDPSTRKNRQIVDPGFVERSMKIEKATRRRVQESARGKEESAQGIWVLGTGTPPRLEGIPIKGNCRGSWERGMCEGRDRTLRIRKGFWWGRQTKLQRLCQKKRKKNSRGTWGDSLITKVFGSSHLQI